MRALVTGAAGFIGSHLVESLLIDGFEVVGIDGFVDFYPRAVKEANLAGARRHPRFRLIEGLLEELPLRSCLEGITEIYHLAAQAGVRTSWGDEFSAYTDHNLLGTQRLLEAALTTRPGRLVYASSSSVYGESMALPLREDASCRPVSPYGVTKLAAEHLCRLYHRSYGLPTVSLRYFTVYGPRQRPDMAFHRFLKACRDGTQVPIYGDGEQTRDFTYVDDIVRATRAAAVSGRPGLVYNVGGGERVSLNAVLRTIEDVTGRRLERRTEPPQRGDMRDTFADTASARLDLGFRSTVSLAEGLSREWEWVRGLAG